MDKVIGLLITAVVIAGFVVILTPIVKRIAAQKEIDKKNKEQE